MTNSAYAKNNGDGLLCSILWLCAGGGLGIIRDQKGCSHFNFTADEEKVGSLTAPLAFSFLYTEHSYGGRVS